MVITVKSSNINNADSEWKGLRRVIYCIAGNFDGFDVFQPNRQNFTRQILKAIQCLVKDTDHPSKYFASHI